MWAPLAELIPFPWREPLEIPTLRGSQETQYLHLTLLSDMWAPLEELIPFPWREPLEIPTLRGSQETQHLNLT